MLSKFDIILLLQVVQCISSILSNSDGDHSVYDVRRIPFAPYSLAQDFHDVENRVNSRYNKVRIKDDSPTTLRNLSPHNKDTFKELHPFSDVNVPIRSHDYNYDHNSMFYSNYIGYKKNEPQFHYYNDYDFLDEISLEELPDYTAEDVKQKENILKDNQSLVIVTTSKRPRNTYGSEKQAIDDDQVITPFVHPDHYLYSNSNAEIQDSITKDPHDNLSKHFHFNEIVNELGTNSYNSDVKDEFSSNVVYDYGDWKPIIFDSMQWMKYSKAPKVKETPIQVSVPNTKPIRFPKESKSTFENVIFPEAIKPFSPVKRMDTVHSILLPKINPASSIHRFAPQHRNIFPEKRKRAPLLPMKLAIPQNIFQTNFDQTDHNQSNSQMSFTNATKRPLLSKLLVSILPRERLSDGGKNSVCYRKTCTQLITGRNLEYARALQIIQSEEYLRYADLEIIKYKRKYNRRKRDNTILHVSKKHLYGMAGDGEEPIDIQKYELEGNINRRIYNNHSNRNRAGKKILKDVRTKSSRAGVCGGIITVPEEILSPNYPKSYNDKESGLPMLTKCKWTIRLPAEQKILLSFTEFHLGENLANNSDCRLGHSVKVQDGLNTTRFCGSNIPLPYKSSGNELLISFAAVIGIKRFSTKDKEENNYIDDITINKTIEVFERQIKSSCTFCFRINISVLDEEEPEEITSAENQNNVLLGDVRQQAQPVLMGAAGVATVLASAMAKKLFFAESIRKQFPLPRMVGEGIPPSVASQTMKGAAALRLVPEGLTPIAVFPPYQTPRSINAISVIWLEDIIPPKIRKATIRQKIGILGLWTKEQREINHIKRRARKNESKMSYISRNSKTRQLKDTANKLRKHIICNKMKRRLGKNDILSNTIDHNKGNMADIFDKLTKFLHPLLRIFETTATSKGLERSYKCVNEDKQKFGFRTLVTLVDEDPCIFGVTCELDGNKIHFRNANDTVSNDRNKHINGVMNNKTTFVPSERFQSTDMESDHPKRKRKRRQTSEQITALQPICRVARDISGRPCLKKP